MDHLFFVIELYKHDGKLKILNKQKHTYILPLTHTNIHKHIKTHTHTCTLNPEYGKKYDHCYISQLGEHKFF